MNPAYLLLSILIVVSKDLGLKSEEEIRLKVLETKALVKRSENYLQSLKMETGLAKEHNNHQTEDYNISNVSFTEGMTHFKPRFVRQIYPQDSEILKSSKNLREFQRYLQSLRVDEEQTKSRFARQISSQGQCLANCETKKYFFPRCYCDIRCTLYNDCCLKYVQTAISAVSSDEAEKIRLSSCVTDGVTPASRIENVGYHMISNCPAGSKFAPNCTRNIGLNVPVSDEAGFTYRNIYCAFCHGVTDYTVWGISFLLDSCKNGNHGNYLSSTETRIETKIDLLRKENCKMVYLPPNVMSKTIFSYPRMCIKRDRRYVLNENELCKRYQNPVQIIFSSAGKSLIKNYHCLQNIIAPSSTCYEPYERGYDFLTVPGKGTIHLMPMTVMFQFDNKLHNPDNEDSCLGGQKVLDKCISIPCVEGMEQKCVTETILSGVLSLNVVLVSEQIPSENFLERALKMYFLFLPTDIYGDFSLYRIYGSVNCSQSCCISKATINITSNTFIPIQDFNKLKSLIEMIRFTYNETQPNSSIIYSASNSMECKTQTYHQSYYSVNKGDFEYFLRDFNFQNLNSSIDKIPYNLTVYGRYSAQQEISITNWSVFYLESNESIIVGQGQSLATLSYMIQSIITYTTMGVSTFVLFGTLFVFTFFGLYKSLAENVCINIMSSLSLGNILFMFGIGATENQDVCLAIGAVLHCIWLSFLTWVSLYTFLISKLLIKMKTDLAYNISNDYHKKHIYSVGYGLPILTVSMCLVLEFTGPNNFKIGYNGGVCFPTRFPANLIFFSIPVILSFIINAVLLFVCGRHLKSYQSQTMLKSTNRTLSYTIPFIKLCLISGFFWIFGILAQVLKNEILGYVFVIVSGSQGLIASLCFLNSQLIQRKIRNYFGSKFGNDTEIMSLRPISHR